MDVSHANAKNVKVLCQLSMEPRIECTHVNLTVSKASCSHSIALLLLSITAQSQIVT